MLDPHHLELFYFVAKHKGISAATRYISYCIGQSTISGHMSALERRIDAALFQRRPFKLTEKGALLFAQVRRLYDNLPELEKVLTSGPVERLCLVVDDLIGAGFLSAVVAAITRRNPAVVLEIHAASQAKAEASLAGGEADAIITASDRTLPGVRSELLARATPTLLVSETSAIKTPGHFWAQMPIAERLIYPVEPGLLHHTFERGLQALGVNWQPHRRVNSPAVMREMVAGGQGVGLGLGLPESGRHPKIRAIPLNHFEPIPVTVCWKARTKPLVAIMVAVIRDTAQKQWKAQARKMVK
ncbi:MAG: LysR family transcriptional regulator [Lacunisphaera sp.]